MSSACAGLRQASRIFSLGLAVLVIAGCGGAPDNADDHLRRADAYVERGEDQEAIIEYRVAVQLDPMRGDVRFKLGDTYMRVGNRPAALREYVRAADLMPRDRKAQMAAGNLLLAARA